MSFHITFEPFCENPTPAKRVRLNEPVEVVPFLHSLFGENFNGQFLSCRVFEAFSFKTIPAQKMLAFLTQLVQWSPPYNDKEHRLVMFHNIDVVEELKLPPVFYGVITFTFTFPKHQEIILRWIKTRNHQPIRLQIQCVESKVKAVNPEYWALPSNSPLGEALEKYVEEQGVFEVSIVHPGGDVENSFSGAWRDCLINMNDNCAK